VAGGGQRVVGAWHAMPRGVPGEGVRFGHGMPCPYERTGELLTRFGLVTVARKTRRRRFGTLAWEGQDDEGIPFEFEGTEPHLLLPGARTVKPSTEMIPVAGAAAAGLTRPSHARLVCPYCGNQIDLEGRRVA